MRYLMVILLLISFSFINAQEDENSLIEKNVIQLSGMVLTGDSLYPVPFTTVYRIRDKRGTVTNLEGFFSLTAYTGDTITFSNVGFITTAFVVPEDLEENRYSMVQIISQDTIMLPTAQIFPWPATRTKFKQELLAMDMPGNTDYLASYNYNDLADFDGMIDMEAAQAGSYDVITQQNYSNLYYAGQSPLSGIINPIAWAQFVKGLKKK